MIECTICNKEAETLSHYEYCPYYKPKTCKTCGYRNKLNSHCTLNQLSKPVDDNHSCEEWESRK